MNPDVLVPSGDAVLALLSEAGSRIDGPIAVVLPALGMRARHYGEFARRLSPVVHQTMLLDWRGQGYSRPGIDRRSRHGFAEMIDDDLPAVVRAVRQLYPGAPILFVGHSLGGQVATAYVNGPGPAIDGLVLLAAGTPHYRQFTGARSVWALAGTSTVAAVATLAGYWPGDRLRFAGRQARGVVADWARYARTGQCPGASGPPSGAPGLRVLSVTLSGDQFAPAGAVTGLLAELPNALIERCQVTAGTASDPHTTWTRQPEPVAASVSDWLTRIDLKGPQDAVSGR